MSRLAQGIALLYFLLLGVTGGITVWRIRRNAQRPVAAAKAATIPAATELAGHVCNRYYAAGLVACLLQQGGDINDIRAAFHVGGHPVQDDFWDTVLDIVARQAAINAGFDSEATTSEGEDQ